MLELHCHTTYSDGTLTPTQLVSRAVERGVKALAITDHDTVAGWEAAIAASQPYPDLEIVPGIELSTVCKGRSMHILGFYPNPKALQNPLKERLAGRQRRAQAMAAKLAALGYPIDLSGLPGDHAPGRPHIASALVAAGHVQSSKEAFDRFIREDGPAYVPYEKFTAAEGIALLRQCGAVPVWAHPYLFRGGTVPEVLPELVKAGLMGVEVYHPNHSPSDQRHLETLCQQYDLLVTGGSDYHGPPAQGKKDKHSDLNSLQVSLELLAPLKKAAASLQARQQSRRPVG
ncbi:MAG: PHP domain-containing protein [Cyanobacteria bacterium P01_A01_bin.114]